jgi:hypothetical protein
VDKYLTEKTQARKTEVQDTHHSVEELLMQAALRGDGVNHVFFKIYQDISYSEF